MRQYEELVTVLGVILGLKKQNEWEKIEKEIFDATKKFTSLSIDHIENLTNDGFTKEILNHPTLTPGQLKVLADLLFEKLDFYAVKNEEKKYNDLKEKCITLYSHIRSNFTENEFDMNVYYKLEILKKQ